MIFIDFAFVCFLRQARVAKRPQALFIWLSAVAHNCQKSTFECFFIIVVILRAYNS